MATNASTWFYSEPEHVAYLISERVNHTFWANRVSGLHVTCIQAEPPFRVAGEWRGVPIEIEWVPNEYLTLSARAEHNVDLLLIGIKEILGIVPTISFVDSSGTMQAEWRVRDVEARVQSVQGNPNYRQIKRYTR